MIPTRKKVLFLCTGNSCRSQMAEGLLRHLFGDRYEAFSAGLKPGCVHPKAIVVMKEIGIDISTQRSKPLSQFSTQKFDTVVTVCDNALETCPVFPQAVRHVHWSFFDPAAAQGTENAVLKEFRVVRDLIAKKLRAHFGI